MTKWNLPQNARLVQHTKINVIYHVNRLKDKNHMIISVDVEEAFDEIPFPIMMKTLNKIGIEGNFLNRVKSIYEKLMANFMLVVKD